MLEKDLQIINKLGIHARAATLLIKLAEEFDADITLSCNGMDADAKSILDVLMLAATCGTTVTLRIEGVDSEEEQKAMESISELINNRFNEKE